MPNAIAHFPPVSGIHFYGVVPYVIELGQVISVGLPGSFRAFLMLKVLKIYPHAKTNYDEDKYDNKMLPCFYQNGAFKF